MMIVRVCPFNVPFPLIQAAISINEEFAVNGITDQVCVFNVYLIPLNILAVGHVL